MVTYWFFIMCIVSMIILGTNTTKPIPDDVYRYIMEKGLSKDRWIRIACKSNAMPAWKGHHSGRTRCYVTSQQVEHNTEAKNTFLLVIDRCELSIGRICTRLDEFCVIYRHCLCHGVETAALFLTFSCIRILNHRLLLFFKHTHRDCWKI